MFFCDSYYYTFHLFRVKCRTLLNPMVFRAFSGFLQQRCMHAWRRLACVLHEWLYTALLKKFIPNKKGRALNSSLRPAGNPAFYSIFFSYSLLI